jgi:thiosulfate dehydrogenase
MGKFLFRLLLTLVVIAAGLYACLRLGFLNVRADLDPSGFESSLMTQFLNASIERHAIYEKSPIEPTPANLMEGMKLYEAKCTLCHGDVNQPQSPLVFAFYPRAPQFLKDRPDMPDYQNHYIIKHGIRWTGMPAWGDVLSDEQIWQVATFLSHLENLPADVKQEWKKSKP